MALKKQWIAYLLWIFLGWCGLHAFYCGRRNLGFAILLFYVFVWILASYSHPCEYTCDEDFGVYGLFFACIFSIFVISHGFFIPKWIRVYNERMLHKEKLENND
jgi:hypothetical protein